MHRRNQNVVIALTLLFLFSLSAFAAPKEDPIRAGYKLYYQGDLRGAYQHFRRLAARNPNDVAAAYGVLSALFARDLSEESLEKEIEQRAAQLIELAKARYDKDPRDMEALFYLAQTHGVRAGYRFQRRKSLLGAARDASKSKKYSEAYVKQNPEHADAYIALGLYNYYADIAPSMLKFVRFLLMIPGGDKKLGLQQLERAARTGEMWSPQARLELAQIYTWLEGRLEDGLKLTQGLRRDYPDNPDLTLRLARLYAGPVVEDSERAAREFTHVLKRAERNHPHYTQAVRYQALLGLAQVRAGQWQLEEAITLLHPMTDSPSTKPLWAKPRSLLARGRYRALLNKPNAEEDAQRVLSNPRWKKLHIEARQQLNWIQKRKKSGEAARFAELIPGNRLVAQRRFELARKFYLQKKLESPKDWQVRYRFARLSFLQKKFQKARAEFREILRRNNSQTPGWLQAGAKLHLARLHDLRGERKQALKLYDDVVDDYEQEPAALAARIGLLTPYKRLQLAAR